MKRNILTILGCSGSLVLTLGASEVQANSSAPLRELIFTADNSPEMLTDDEFNCLCTGEAPEGEFWNNDRLGDAAIAQYGCDCAGCRFIVMERMQAENQSEIPVIQ